MTTGFWIGHPGHLMFVPGHVGSVGVEHDMGITRHSAPGGSYAFASTRRASRTYQVTTTALTPAETYPLHALATEISPPYAFVSVEAAESNVLTPEAALVTASGLPRVGGYDLADGGHVATAAHNPDATSNPMEARVWAGAGPVLPGRKVTAGLYLASAFDAYVQLMFVDANNGPISWVDGGTVTGVDRLRRSTVTGTAPVNAVAAYVLGIRAQYLAQASLSWTSAPVEWGPGGFVQQCVVTGLSESLRLARPGPLGRIRDVTFEVSEVGV